MASKLQQVITWLSSAGWSSASTARTDLGLGTLATQSGTFSGTSSGTNTGDQNAGTVSFTPGGGLVSTDVQGAIIEAAGAGGGAPWSSAEIDFGSLSTKQKNFTITAPGSTTSSKIVAVLSDKPAAGRAVGDAEWDQIILTARPGTGSFVLIARATPGPVVGKRTILYQINT